MTARLALTGLKGGRGSTTAFRDVDLSVAEGEILTLLGPNGAGKTTLLLTVSGLLPAQEGTVAVDGVDLRVRRGDRHAICARHPPARVPAWRASEHRGRWQQELRGRSGQGAGLGASRCGAQHYRAWWRLRGWGC